MSLRTQLEMKEAGFEGTEEEWYDHVFRLEEEMKENHFITEEEFDVWMDASDGFYDWMYGGKDVDKYIYTDGDEYFTELGEELVAFVRAAVKAKMIYDAAGYVKTGYVPDTSSDELNDIIDQFENQIGDDNHE